MTEWAPGVQLHACSIRLRDWRKTVNLLTRFDLEMHKAPALASSVVKKLAPGLKA
jgi:hypothetical protein